MTFAPPGWVTPKGFIFTATELTTSSFTVTATNTSSYLLLNGSLPPGFSLSTSTGIISGIPDPVLNLTTYKFSIRAYNPAASIDRTFSIDVQGSDSPIWTTVTLTTGPGDVLITSTSEGYLPLGTENQPYAYNKQYIDFQFTAQSIENPSNTKIEYYIPDQGGQLPSSLHLDKNGKLTGILNCYTATDVSTSTSFTETVYIPKEYQFYISATDSVRHQSRLFKMITVDPMMLKDWDTTGTSGIYILDVSLQTQPYNFLQKPQFLQNSDLGIIRAENFHVIDVSAYDPAPLLGTLTYSLITGTTVTSNIPKELELETNQGFIYGYIPYQPVYTQSYSFVVEARKTFYNITTSTRKTFNLQVKGLAENTISWISTSSLGSILEGQISDLYIEAEQTDAEYDIKYYKIGGELPQGLTLQSDGTITGRVNYNTSGTYIFTATAQNIYALSAVEKTFALEVEPASNEFTEIYIKSFLPKEKRETYFNFIDNQDIFNQDFIYRYYDTNFGLQKEPRIVLEFGIQKIEPRDFYSVLNTNFYRRKFYFGEIKILPAKNKLGETVYELIYAEVIDDLTFEDKSVSLSVSMNTSTYYPASIDNMKYRLQNITVGNTATILTDNRYNPIFLTNIQSNDQNTISYIKYIPICYAKPGQGNKILNRIKFSQFNFKQFYIETDRLIVKNAIGVQGESYVFYPKNSIKN